MWGPEKVLGTEAGCGQLPKEDQERTRIQNRSLALVAGRKPAKTILTLRLGNLFRGCGLPWLYDSPLFFESSVEYLGKALKAIGVLKRERAHTPPPGVAHGYYR